MRSRPKPTPPSVTVSVRLSGEEDRIVRGLARRQRSTVSDVIRDAVAGFVEDEPERPYDRIADLIGSVSGLPAGLSEDAGTQFAGIVQARAGRRK